MLFSEEEKEIAKLHLTIYSQREYIAELEQKVDDLQKALDAVLLNKYRARKVKVKYIGRI